MAKRKQARPSRPGGSAPTNDNVAREDVENEEEGELATVSGDVEETPGVLNEVNQATRRNNRRSRKKNLGNFWTRAFYVFCEFC